MTNVILSDVVSLARIGLCPEQTVIEGSNTHAHHRVLLVQFQHHHVKKQWALYPKLVKCFSKK